MYDPYTAYQNEYLADPSYAAANTLLALSNAGGGVLSDESQSTFFRLLGFNSVVAANGGRNFTVPSLDTMASQMWLGTTHTVAGMTLLMRDQNTTYPATAYYVTSGWTRDEVFIRTTYALFALWAILLIILTAIFFRPAVSSSIDAYTAARLAARTRGCLDGYGLQDEHGLAMEFKQLGDGSPLSPVGMIEAGAGVPLQRKRTYR